MKKLSRSCFHPQNAGLFAHTKNTAEQKNSVTKDDKEQINKYQAEYELAKKALTVFLACESAAKPAHQDSLYALNLEKKTATVMRYRNNIRDVIQKNKSSTVINQTVLAALSGTVSRALIKELRTTLENDLAQAKANLPISFISTQAGIQR